MKMKTLQNFSASAAGECYAHAIQTRVEGAQAAGLAVVASHGLSTSFKPAPAAA